MFFVYSCGQHVSLILLWTVYQLFNKRILATEEIKVQLTSVWNFTN
jgi:hypothetical protein